MRRMILLLALVACRPPPPKEIKRGTAGAVFEDEATGFQVQFNQMSSLFTERGEPGEIHPAVLEYVLSAEESPLAAYYDLVLALPSPPSRAAKDLAALAAEAKRLAGTAAPRGRHYARALARKLAPEINVALRLDFGDAAFNDTQFLGTAGLSWGLAADLEANVLQRRYERSAQALRTVIVRHATAGLVVLRSSGTDRLFVWDIGGIPGAFDPTKPLDHDTVAAQIVALHPYRTAPGRAP